MPNPNHVIAYFSLEIGLEDAIPTYCGGLGMLAGDTIKSAADMGLPLVCCTLCYRDGYFTQTLDRSGRQKEAPVDWSPEKTLEEMPQRVYVPIEGRNVIVRCFRKIYRGLTGKYVPIYFLDTDLPENTAADRKITRKLYQGDTDDNIKQRAVLGIAGPRMLRALTHDVATFHMNEGHACMLLIEQMSEHLARFDKSDIDEACMAYARGRSVFTTHTPVPAGHDQYPVARMKAIIGDHPIFKHPDLWGGGRTFHASKFCLNLTRYANGVAKRHGEVSREMFPGYPIDHVTNGVHLPTWASPYMAPLFDAYCPDWRTDNAALRLAVNISDKEILGAHAQAKAGMIKYVNNRAEGTLEPDRFTITFARRATPYKRPTLIMTDIERLIRMNAEIAPVQLVFCGKAHPADGKGKDGIQTIFKAARELKKHFPIVYVPNYDMELAKHLVSGSELWLNNPEPPLEASGTSGMKAALNGVPSLSSIDGWWVEGHAEHITGWSIEGKGTGDALIKAHADSAYTKLERDILPTWRNDTEYWPEIMRSCIAINGAHFSTERMLREYIQRAYLD
ncbi:MAG: alpha-glucan family phosphorylase [Phycisphaerales bacterium]